MRLISERQGSSGAGLNRYNGRGIYSAIGRKVLLSGLREVTNTVEKANHSQLITDAGSDELIKEQGKGIDVSTNTVKNEDVADTSNIEKSPIPESDKESSLETISNSSKEEFVSNDEESIVDNDKLLEKADEVTPAAGAKRKFPAFLQGVM